MSQVIKQRDAIDNAVAEYLEKGGTITVKQLKPRSLRISVQTRSIVAAYDKQAQHG